MYVLLKMHHAAANGVTYAELLSVRREPDPPVPLLAELPTQGSELEMALSGLAGFVSDPSVSSPRCCPRYRQGVARCRPAHEGRPRYGRSVLRAAHVAEPPFHRTAHRRLHPGRTRRRQRVKNHFGVTVNDVVMALASVVRQFAVSTGRVTRQIPCRPWFLRRSTSRSRGFSQPGVRNVHPIADQIADPVQRLIAVARANTIAKEQSAAIGATLLGDWFEIFGGAAWASPNASTGSSPVSARCTT